MLVLEGFSQEDHKLRASLGYVVKLCLRKINKWKECSLGFTALGMIGHNWLVPVFLGLL